MSGPVSTDDAPGAPAAGHPEACDVEVLEGRAVDVGGLAVRRLLPRRRRRTVGAWCFVDHLGPAVAGLGIGPHPHIGLQTVTWLLEGAVLHRDSLGSEQVIRPGQLNLMTAGRGVAHAEEGAGTLHGVQLWVAQPSATRDDGPAFEHHAVLPQVEVGEAVATVLVGSLLGAASGARRDTDHTGVDLALRAGRAVLPLDPASEYGLVVLEGSVAVGPHRLGPGRLAYLGTGRDEVPIDAGGPARAMLLGGRPFDEPLLMWWNYVARTPAEITEAHRAWTEGDGRFGQVRSPLHPMTAPAPPWAAG
ncbi:MAG TPA: pirin family protein [Acidimicrobiales bacterium]|nr:pirin family protein [Acidimicrobiales bacterium]